MIKEMRKNYHKPNHSYDSFAIEAEIYEKQKEALEQGEGWHWVLDELHLSKSTYNYHLRKNGALRAMHKKIPAVVKRTGTWITVKDLKKDKAMRFKSISEAERKLDLGNRALYNYLRRRQGKPYLKRYEVERG